MTLEMAKMSVQLRKILPSHKMIGFDFRVNLFETRFFEMSLCHPMQSFRLFLLTEKDVGVTHMRFWQIFLLTLRRGEALSVFELSLRRGVEIEALKNDVAKSRMTRLSGNHIF